MQKEQQKVPQKDSALRPGHMGKVWKFLIFPKSYPHGGGNQKNISKLPKGPRRRSMPNLVDIIPEVWAQTVAWPHFAWAIKKYPNPPPPKKEQNVPQKDSTLCPGPYGESLDF